VRRQQKVELVEQLKEDLGSSPAAVVVEYKGVTVTFLTNLRNSLRAKGAVLRVVKNTLLLRAVEGTYNEELKTLTGGPIAIAFIGAEGDPAALAKELVTYAKQESFLVIRGGVLTGKALDEAGIRELATLPSLDEMRAKTLGLFNAPAEKFLGTLLAAPRDFLGVLLAKVDKEENATN
jgi:large subunit ribosomal protein L10